MREQRGAARVQLPQRHQAEIFGRSLDQLIRAEALVRTVVTYCESLDLSELYAPIKATRDNLGRTPIDPRILFELWLFATLEGENSGRRINELCKRDLAYMWICGEVTVNYHTLCDFRTQHGALLSRILTDSIALLHLNGLIKLETIAQDAMRVRAQAIYRRRAPAAEFPNAVCRNQGLNQFSVRGLARAKTQVLWHALSYNFRRFMNLIDEKTGNNYLEVLMES